VARNSPGTLSGKVKGQRSVVEGKEDLDLNSGSENSNVEQNYSQLNPLMRQQPRANTWIGAL
jgi:hypothetical protein